MWSGEGARCSSSAQFGLSLRPKGEEGSKFVYDER